MSAAPSKIETDDYDPVFLHSRREAAVIFCVWLIGMIWAVPFCYFYGYMSNIKDFDPSNISTVLGIPTWLFWGIFVPWLVADVITTWFCFGFMAEDDLGEDPPPQEGFDKASIESAADAEEKESDE